MLAAGDVAGYLLDRKLVSPREIVDGGLRVEDASRQNRVFVATAGARGYVLKLAGAAAEGGVAHEAAVLERLPVLDRGGPLAACVPLLVGYDAAAGVLILEALPGARDLRGQHARGQFSCSLARRAGRALARLHAIPPAALAGIPRVAHPARANPVHRPDLDTTRGLSPAALELTRIVQGVDELCGPLDDLLATWSEPSLIHGDVRWDNCLAVRGGGTNRWTGLQLIDWELCGAGDPGLDVGAFLGEYLRAWLQSVPIADPRDPGRLLAHARLPLRRMRPALRAFWDAYAQRRRLTAAESAGTLRRATGYAALRLVTAALEEAQTLSELRPSVLHLLPLSRNLLLRPDEASAHLLGLGAATAAA